MKQFFSRMKGYDKNPPRNPFSKIAWSWLGAFLGIFLVSISGQWVGIFGEDSLFLIGSFGATAVLIYGIPSADLAQPRNVIIGHLVSALIGVTLYQFVPIETSLLCAASVASSIAVMHYLRALHPPGGATALIAIIGSDKVHKLGYKFILSPVLTGCLIMLLIALIVNNLSKNPKRHYPKYWW